MPLFETPLISLMNQRLEYLSKRSQLLTENIGLSDVKGAKRKDIKPFDELIKRKNISPTTRNNKHLKINSQDIITFNQGIEKEMEILDLNHNTLNHQALVDVLGTLHRLYKVAIGKQS
ncbi:MAG: hypothetical protein HEEMFOPI_00518 [Holosporales bacterium]